MGTSSEELDSGPGTGDEAGVEDENRVHGMGQPALEQQTQHTIAQGKASEKRTKVTEIDYETIASIGIHEVSSAINSLDDHFQAGLQELRNSLSRLKQEKTLITDRLHTVSEKLFEVTAERDRYQQAIAELQQEVSDVRQQLSNEQNNNSILQKKIQDIEDENKNQLYSIAGHLRNRHLAHRSIVKWRKKVMDRGRYSAVHLLEDENSHLRAELLKCQEAAKQAFLRSANALNSEAITMFQDAATRRLGYDVSLDGGRSSSPPPRSSSSDRSSPEPIPPSAEVLRGAGGGRRFEDVGDREWERRKGSDEGEEGREPEERSRGSRGSIHLMGPSEHYRGALASSQESLESVESGGDPALPRGGPSGGESLRHAGQGVVPKRGRTPINPYYAPDSLREETRAKLSQLQGGRRIQEAANHPHASHPPPPPQSISAKTTLTSRHHSAPNLGPRSQVCRCRAPPATGPADPYRCPYCTPIQNSSFGHARDAASAAPKKKKAVPPHDGGGSNVARNAILRPGGSLQQQQHQEARKVIYRPSASTVVIEKHLKN